MDRKYQIFISSTYKDLIPEREKVRDVILSMYHFPIGMEMFNAADEEQWEIIKETIDSSDYYILIIGKRYGTLIKNGEDAGMSFTEKEYRYAVTKGIPVLTFIKKDSAVTADQMDTKPENIAKLQALVTEITGIREADWFASVEELGTKVTLALHKQFNRKKRPGWVRGDRFDVDASLNELVILSQRVRKLEDENEKLRESVVQRKPVLSVTMKYEGTIEQPLESDEELAGDIGEYGEESASDTSKYGEESASDTGECGETVCSSIESDAGTSVKETVRRRRVYQTGYLGNVEPLTPEDIPDEVKDVVTQEMLDAYNRELPDQAEVDTYEKKMRFYHEVKWNGQRLDFMISNDGTAKATDINVTLEFPKSFHIMERSAAENRQKPKKPKMPKNPVEEAMEKKYIARMTGGAGSLKDVMHLMGNSYSGLGLSEVTPLSVGAPLWDTNQRSDWDVHIDGHTVEIWSRDLLHTYTQTADELCILPTQTGTFRIKVTIMCEQYIHPEESELEIVVE